MEFFLADRDVLKKTKRAMEAADGDADVSTHVYAYIKQR